MRFRHIEVFHAVYTCGSITKAAEFLHVSQPSVSKVLQHAELSLGYELFHRVKGRLVPTDRANQLFQEVDRLQEQITSVRRSARNLSNEGAGKIKVATTPAFAFGPLPGLIQAFRADLPNVSFDVQTRHFGALERAVIEHQVDFAVGFGQPHDPRLKSSRIGKASVKLLIPRSRATAGGGKISLKSVQSHPFISIAESGPLGLLIKRYLDQQNIQLNEILSVQTYYLAARMVETGLGSALLDEFSAASLRSDAPVVIKELTPQLGFPLFCFFHEDRPISGTSQAFLDRVRQWGKNHLQ